MKFQPGEMLTIIDSPFPEARGVVLLDSLSINRPPPRHVPFGESVMFLHEVDEASIDADMDFDNWARFWIYVLSSVGTGYIDIDNVRDKA